MNFNVTKLKSGINRFVLLCVLRSGTVLYLYASLIASPVLFRYSLETTKSPLKGGKRGARFPSPIPIRTAAYRTERFMPPRRLSNAPYVLSVWVVDPSLADTLSRTRRS